MHRPPPLRLLYRDAHYVAVHKPSGMLLHRSALASGETSFALQVLRDQLGQRLYPVHRLDRATAGVLLFALDPEAAQRLGEAFMAGAVAKIYHAVVRGWVDPAGSIDHPVRDRDLGGPARPALTHYRRLAQAELPFAVDRYPTSRYSLVEIRPQTGRRHQIRQHFKHISHPLIGDTSYGNGRHNRLFREQFGSRRLLLEAHSLSFHHPYRGEPCRIEGIPDATWTRVAAIFALPGGAPGPGR